MDPLVLGSFQLVESHNFDAFMQRLGVGYLTRSLGNRSHPVVTVSREPGGQITMKQESLVSTSQIIFKLNEQFDETTADGRKVKSTITLTKPNELRHEMRAADGGKDSVCVRQFLQDTMKCVCHVDEVETSRLYKRLS